MKTVPKTDRAIRPSAVKVEGKKIHYITAGQGPAVILLHGYTQTSRMWRPLIEKLKGKFTFIAPDLPGIGNSDIPKSGADMRTAAVRIHALARSLGITKARVVRYRDMVHYLGMLLKNLKLVFRFFCLRELSAASIRDAGRGVASAAS